jgi:hypothetical protein
MSRGASEQAGGCRCPADQKVVAQKGPTAEIIPDSYEIWGQDGRPEKTFPRQTQFENQYDLLNSKDTQE